MCIKFWYTCAVTNDLKRRQPGYNQQWSKLPCGLPLYDDHCQCPRIQTFSSHSTACSSFEVRQTNGELYRWDHGALFRQNPFTFVITLVVKGSSIIILTMSVFVCVSFRQCPTDSSPQYVLFHCNCVYVVQDNRERLLCVEGVQEFIKSLAAQRKWQRSCTAMSWWPDRKKA